MFLTAEPSLQTQYIYLSRVLWAILGWQEVGRHRGVQTSGLEWLALNCFLQCSQGETMEGWGEGSLGSYSRARGGRDS